MRWSAEEHQKFVNFFPKNMKKIPKKMLDCLEGGVIYSKQDFGKTKLLLSIGVKFKGVLIFYLYFSKRFILMSCGILNRLI